MVAADEWAQLSAGLGQRARALDAFLRDIYSEQAIVADGLIGLHAVDRAPGFRSTGRLAGNVVRAHISGTDLVCDGAGRWLVLEDNLRVPSGIGYAIVNHRLLSEHLPELHPPTVIEDVDQVPQMLLETLREAAPRHAPDDAPLSRCCPRAGRTRRGSSTPSWPRKWVSLWCSPRDLSVRDAKLVRHIGSDVEAIDVVYARMDEDMLLSSTGHDGAALRPGLLGAIVGGNLTIANALANGVADDKAIYAYVPAMIEYYLGEKPMLGPGPTWICGERAQRDYVLDPPR